MTQEPGLNIGYGVINEYGVEELNAVSKHPQEILDYVPAKDADFLKAIASETITISGDSTPDEDDTMICERHNLSLYLHECEGFDF